MRNIFKRRLGVRHHLIFFLAILPLMLFLQACVVASERPHYSQEPPPRLIDLQKIEGQWSLNADVYTGKLEFFKTGRTWAGRIWFDVYQKWEDLTEIFFDPRIGRLEFYRPYGNQRYSGTLSGNQIVGTFTDAGRNLPWEARREAPREPPPRPVDLRGVEGPWSLQADVYPGKLEFFRRGNIWGGRIWFDVYQRWEDLTEIFFDPRTGRLEFYRPYGNQRYSGTLSGNQIIGTFTDAGRNLPWEARRF